MHNSKKYKVLNGIFTKQIPSLNNTYQSLKSANKNIYIIPNKIYYLIVTLAWIHIYIILNKTYVHFSIVTLALIHFFLAPCHFLLKLCLGDIFNKMEKMTNL